MILDKCIYIIRYRVQDMRYVRYEMMRYEIHKHVRYRTSDAKHEINEKKY